jgi:ATP-dependent Clp protease ATP-binding subunit ClpC
MFERFTDRARRVVVLAQEEARLLNHNYIGTEHILLGLVREGDGVAARALESLGISLEAVRQHVEEIIGRGKQAPSGHIPFTPRAKKVLELSLREAHQLGHNYIGTEHILLGLIREGEGVAAQVLVRLGADLNRVRQQVIELLAARDPEDPGRRVAVARDPEASGPIAVAGEAGEDVPLPRTVTGGRWVAEVQNALAKITERLEAIERHLGMTVPAAEPGGPSGKADPPGETEPPDKPDPAGETQPPGQT